MNKRGGFTLIELIVGMAICTVIFGAFIMLFNQGAGNMAHGMNQEQAYEEARVAVREIKTTLKYADPDQVDPKEPLIRSTQLKYPGSMFLKHMDPKISNEDTVNYKTTITWYGSKKKQIKIQVQDTDNSNKDLVTPIIFPKQEANSGFSGNGDDFPVVYQEYTGSETGSGTAGGTGTKVYMIKLPVKYKSGNDEVIEILSAFVTPLVKDTGDTVENTSDTTSNVTTAKALWQAATETTAFMQKDTKNQDRHTDSSATHANWLPVLNANLGTVNIAGAWVVVRAQGTTKLLTIYMTDLLDNSTTEYIDEKHIANGYWFYTTKYAYDENGDLTSINNATPNKDGTWANVTIPKGYAQGGLGQVQNEYDGTWGYYTVIDYTKFTTDIDKVGYPRLGITE